MIHLLHFVELEECNSVTVTVTIWAQPYDRTLRKIYINLENHREYLHRPYIARI